MNEIELDWAEEQLRGPTEPCRCVQYREGGEEDEGYQHIDCRACQNRLYVTRKSYVDALNAYMMAILQRRDQELDAAGRFSAEELRLFGV